jgi:hypothetical protein
MRTLTTSKGVTSRLVRTAPTVADAVLCHRDEEDKVDDESAIFHERPVFNSR